jgi:hypothetical protein
MKELVWNNIRSKAIACCHLKAKTPILAVAIVSSFMLIARLTGDQRFLAALAHMRRVDIEPKHQGTMMLGAKHSMLNLVTLYS